MSNEQKNESPIMPGDSAWLVDYHFTVIIWAEQVDTVCYTKNSKSENWQEGCFTNGINDYDFWRIFRTSEDLLKSYERYKASSDTATDPDDQLLFIKECIERKNTLLIQFIPELSNIET
jgi:hypothetical protein